MLAVIHEITLFFFYLVFYFPIVNMYSVYIRKNNLLNDVVWISIFLLTKYSRYSNWVLRVVMIFKALIFNDFIH